ASASHSPNINRAPLASGRTGRVAPTDKLELAGMAERISHDTAPVMALHVPLPILVVSGVYVLLLLIGDRLLNDPDTYWHLVIGQWIVEHRAVPHTDVFSYTMNGAPWIANQWLSQVLYAAGYALAGWTGIVVMAVAAIAAACGLLARFLLERLPVLPAL